MDVPSTLTALNQAFNIAKSLVEVRDPALLNAKVIELQRTILDAQEQAMQMQGAKLELLERIQALASECQKLRCFDDIIWENPYYWNINGDTKDGPFCQLCYDKDRATIRLQGLGSGIWRCHSCNHTYYDSSYRPRPIEHDLGY